jgi:membrane protein implicated in regulation of membrane protease activity
MRRRPPSPPPRWMRHSLAFAPAVGMTACTASVLLVHPMLIDVVTLPLSVLAVLPLWWFARSQLRADRHATPPMTDRYRTLARLLDTSGDGEVRVDVDGQVAILLLDERHKNGSASRAFMRFDRNELAEAADDEWRTPVVFHQFTLDDARPVVRHRIGAVIFTCGEDGHTRMADVPQPPQRRRDLLKTAFLLDRTAADIPAVNDLDVLIEQIRSGTTPTA